MTTEEGKPIGNVIRIDEEKIRGHLDRIVRSSVEETLSGLLDAEADRLVGAGRYERNEARQMIGDAALAAASCFRPKLVDEIDDIEEGAIAPILV